MKARDLIRKVATRGAAPGFKAAGFRKVGLRFTRKLGGVEQVVEFQLSAYNFADTGRFFINVGLAFDELWTLDGVARAERLAASMCPISGRIEDFVTDAPARWDVSAATAGDALAAELAGWTAALLAELDRLGSIPAVLGCEGLVEGAIRARLRYAIGDRTGALADLRVVAATFTDRQGMSVEELIRRYHLLSLADAGGSVGP